MQRWQNGDNVSSEEIVQSASVCMFVIDGKDKHDQMAKIIMIRSIAIMERSIV
jgi:hypothetical protein